MVSVRYKQVKKPRFASSLAGVLKCKCPFFLILMIDNEMDSFRLMSSPRSGLTETISLGFPGLYLMKVE